MHNIEPYYNWRNLYIASEDPRSPFFEREYSEMYFTETIYDHYIHPQWDSIDSKTLFLKVIYADYEEGYCVIELLGEWNDTLYNDVMTLKRNLIDLMIDEGINKFILIAENILNFHASDDSYYEEWFEDVEDGWIALVNARDHILNEMKDYRIDYYFISSGKLNDFKWRTENPMTLYTKISDVVNKRLNPA